MLIMLGLVGGIITGLMAVGGGVLLIFLLLFIPPLFGQTYSMHTIAGMVIIQTLFSGSSGVLTYYRHRWVNRFLMKFMGVGTFIGGTLGSYVSGLLHHEQLLLIFAVLSLLATPCMFMNPASPDSVPNENKLLALFFGLGIGVLGGMFGIGAGFLYMPVLLHIFKVHAKTAVGTGLALALLLCLGALLIKIADFEVPLNEGLLLALGAFPGGKIGAYWGKNIKVSLLSYLMACTIAIISLKIWADVLHPYGVLPLSLGLSMLVCLMGLFLLTKRKNRNKENVPSVRDNYKNQSV
ncbi:sulfite exporter TauE/SafE family protein [Ammoniphilus sp. 3BR4]|uniref:sulfite exporter TauE/SafE family protein n=1 Tax=Ammoniphilus sp. 3BR4 TaxID=3158265 RepID=UPI003464FD03